ncbi:MAG: HD domain-containing protein [Candidatus Pacearchaeota archaeon]|nr:HD domain-containing protein [Candidatus Pacearchaeota archaeon]
MEETAKKLYSNLQYHNFQHALDVAKKGLKISEICEKEGILVDKNVVYISLLFHDAGYHENHIEKGFKTKEEYSAHLAENNLKDLGFNKSFIKKVKKAIISTHKDLKFSSTEEKIVRSADLSGLASGFPVFLKNNKNLKKEFEMIHNIKISWDLWKEKTKEIIRFYLSQDIKLTSKYYNKKGKSIFHEKARKNLNKFLKEKL